MRTPGSSIKMKAAINARLLHLVISLGVITLAVDNGVAIAPKASE